MAWSTSTYNHLQLPELTALVLGVECPSVTAAIQLLSSIPFPVSWAAPVPAAHAAKPVCRTMSNPAHRLQGASIVQVTGEMLEYPLFSTVFTMGHKASRQELINNIQLAGCSTYTMLPSQDFRAKKESRGVF